MEVFTKLRGDDQGFRKIKLEDFTDLKLIPRFNAKIKMEKNTKTKFQEPQIKDGRTEVKDHPPGSNTPTQVLR